MEMDKNAYCNIEHVSGFVNWLCINENNRNFKFSYNLNGNCIQNVRNIKDAACQYSWKASIPSGLVKIMPPKLLAPENIYTTIKVLEFLRIELKDSLRKRDSLRHLRACWAILSWGGVTNSSNLFFYTLRYFADCDSQNSGLLDYHSNAHENNGWFDPTCTTERRVNDNVEGMSAGITKIHSLLEDELLIYDSRVAAALAWLVERYCDSISLKEIPPDLVFCLPPPRNGKTAPNRDPVRVRNRNTISTVYPSMAPTPASKTKITKRWARDMLRASWIASRLLDRIDSEEINRGQSFLKLQLGLFVIGYHLNDHRC